MLRGTKEQVGDAQPNCQSCLKESRREASFREGTGFVQITTCAKTTMAAGTISNLALILY